MANPGNKVKYGFPNSKYLGINSLYLGIYLGELHQVLLHGL